MKNTIRVMIVDDHTMVRRGLATLLRIKPDLELVGEASDGEQALQVCGRVQPDVILMDLVMPRLDGAAATRAIRERWPQVQVIALTSFQEKDLVQQALEAGAISYLLKNVSPENLVEAIRAASVGRATLAPEATRVLAQAEKLERLGKAIVDAPPDASTLPELLREHTPAILPDSQVDIRIFPDETILHYPEEAEPAPHPVWEWLSGVCRTQVFSAGMALPWGDRQMASENLLAVPIKHIEEAAAAQPAAIGGICIRQPVSAGAAVDLLPAVESLAAQISSALYAAQVHAQALAQETVTRELAMAGRIQASFLPDALPHIDGWQLAAALEPARETSGDFYDFISLSNGHLGIAIADVADKGMGAALFMALTRTLLRTYAAEHHPHPDRVLAAVSRRMLTDTRADLFVTAFYGILDPFTGSLTYCNAGHNPPLLFSDGGKTLQTLRRTGMALGVMEDTAWEQNDVRMVPGDLLLLYTDGVADAQNSARAFFGQERLLAAVRANIDRSAQDLLDALLQTVHTFTADQPRFDDVTLIAMAREP